MLPAPTYRWSLLSLIATVCLTVPARAATLLELNFQNYDSTSRITTAEEVRSGTPIPSSNFLTSGAATVNTTGTTGFIGDSDVTTGYYENFRSVGTDGLMRSSGTGSSYSTYTGTSGMGPANTMVMFFQPNFTSATSRKYMFSSNITGTANNAVYFMIDNTNKVRLQLGTNDSAILDLSTAVFTWDPTKWYFLAVSYAPGASTGADATIYVRQVGAASGAMTTGSSTTGVDGTPNRAIIIGASADNNVLPQANQRSPMDGKMSYFEWTDTYTSTVGGYDAIYTSLVPEPGAVGLTIMGLGVLGVVLRRRLSARQS